MSAAGRRDPDFRITERISPGFAAFNNLELEAIHRDQTVTFLNSPPYVAAGACTQPRRRPRHDLPDQPDASAHQFLLTDTRQATDPADAATVGAAGRPAGARGQDRQKVARYREHMAFAYRAASDAVERIIQAVGVTELADR